MDNQTTTTTNNNTNQTLQIQPEIKTFLESILTDAGMTALDNDMHEEMLKELYARLDNFLVGIIIDNMPADKLEAFTKLNEENKPKEEIEKFVKEIR